MADKFKVQDGIEFADGTSMTTAATGSASTGDITFEGVKIKGAGTASGDGLGYATMELVPDNNLYSSGQYLIIDPTGPNHIHIRAGGIIDQSQSELIFGGEKLRVSVYENDGNAGVYNTQEFSLRNNTYNAGTADFGTATYTDDGTTKNITLTTVSQAVLEDIWASNNISFLYAYNGAVQYTFKFQGSSSTPGVGQNASFTVLPNNPADTMPADGTTFTQVSFDLQITRTSRLEIDSNDVNIEAADDVRIYSRDTFLLANYSTTDSIQISTQYDTANEKSWYFNSDGNLQLPVGGDIIDSTGTSVLGGGFSGSYNDLTDTPTIPADVSDLTDTTGLLGGGFSGSYNDLTDTPTLFSGNYSDLSGIPTIPADVSDLTDTNNLLITTGDFTFSANTIETDNGAAAVVISINGPDGAPTPAFISKKWSFATDGSINFLDPFLNTADASITTTKVGNWDTAYGWGDHSGAGYLTAVPDDSFESKSTATGVVTHDCATNKVFVHSSISADFTANLTNLNLAAGTATNITLILNQGATAYICNALQIGGVAQTINWQGSSSAPTGNSNKKDVMSFSILNVAGTYTVLGQLVSFG